MQVRGRIEEILFRSEQSTKFIIADYDTNDMFVLTLVDEKFTGAEGETFDFELHCKVKDQYKGENRFSNQRMYVRRMSLVE